MLTLSGSLAPYFRRYRRMLLAGIFFVTVSYLIKSFQGVVIRHLTDGLTEPKLYATQKEVIAYMALLAGLSLTSGFFMFLMRQQIIVMSRHIEYDQKNDIFFHLLNLPAGFFEMNRIGDIMNRISEDVGKVRMFTGPAIMYLTQTFITLVTILFFMFHSSPVLSMYVLIPLPFLSVFIYLITRQIHRYATLSQQELSKITSQVQESMNGIRTIRSSGKKELFKNMMHQSGKNYYEKNLQLAKRDALFSPVVTFLISLTIIITLWKGSELVQKNVITKGTLTEFIFYLYQLTWPFTSIGWVFSLIQRAKASQERIDEIRNTEPEKSTGGIIPSTLNIEFNEIFLKKNFREILSGVTLSIPEKKCVGLTGKTGCGKSTLVQLLQGSASPDKGCIYVGRIPLPQIKKEWWQERLSIVTQEPFLFSESIRNNLLFGCKNPVSDEQLIEITKHCCIHEEILSFKDGYDTLVGERGVNLSGGQKQRICLARALLRNPEILVLDDCLSALDAITSLKILSYLMSLKGTHTILLISSRPNDLVGCDIIYFMKNGKISSGGKHEELLEKEPDYHKLWDLYKKKSLGFSEI